jgi:hypothetical protein
VKDGPARQAVGVERGQYGLFMALARPDHDIYKVTWIPQNSKSIVLLTGQLSPIK